MNEESASLFRIFRVLWFPLSINAMVLGALATFVFFVATWLACLTIGDSGMARPATTAFLRSSVAMVQTFTWPGYATSKNADGVVEHHEAVKGAEQKERVRDDLAIVEAALGGYLAQERARIAGDASVNADAKREATNELATHAGRYRWVYFVQIAAFFFLLATFGVAICRIIGLRIARDEYCTLSSAFAYAWRVKVTGILFPIAVLLPILFLAACNLLVGTLSQIPYLGWLFGILPLPLVIIASLLIVLIGLGGLLSIPLLPAAIAIERKGTYDSLGKTYNYVFARPLPLILYLLMLYVFLECLTTLFVDKLLVERVMKATLVPFWDNDFEKIAAGESSAPGLGGFQRFCAWIYGFVLQVFHLLVVGGLISYALGAGTSMFLVFRRDVDGLDYTDLARDPHDAHAAPPSIPPQTPPPPAA